MAKHLTDCQVKLSDPVCILEPIITRVEQIDEVFAASRHIFLSRASLLWVRSNEYIIDGVLGD